MIRQRLKQFFPFSWRDSLVTLGILIAAFGFCTLLRLTHSGSTYAFMIFLLAVFLISRYTDGFFYGTFSAFVSVLLVNYFFTYPLHAFNFTLEGYPLTILCMLAVAVIMGTVTTQLKRGDQIHLEIEKERTRANLLRGISHDLRTPLTSILGASSAILENQDALSPAEHTKLLSEVKEDAQWLIRMVENLLTVTRMDASSSVTLRKEPEAVEELVADTVQKFHKRFPDWHVDMQIPDELFLVPMDAILIEQVLVNLLENVVFHAKGADHIRLSVRKEDTQAVFSVADNGCGFDTLKPGSLPAPKEISPSLPADSRRNTGIGLSVCSSIIHAHHGALTARNLHPDGAIVEFTLPLEGSL